MVKHEVPFFSQLDRDVPARWRHRACGIVALRILVGYWSEKQHRARQPSFRQLLRKGVTKKAYIANVGWSHKGLVRIASAFGYGGYNRDYAALPKREAFAKLLKVVRRYPVIASVYTDFDPKRGGGHLVVVSGYGKGKLLINDPNDAPQHGMRRRTIAKKRFLSAWKRRFITIYPRRAARLREKQRALH